MQFFCFCPDVFPGPKGVAMSASKRPVPRRRSSARRPAPPVLPPCGTNPLYHPRRSRPRPGPAPCLCPDGAGPLHCGGDSLHCSRRPSGRRRVPLTGSADTPGCRPAGHHQRDLCLGTGNQPCTPPSRCRTASCLIRTPPRPPRGESAGAEVPLVVMCHGFTGDRDGDGHFQPMADALAQQGHCQHPGGFLPGKRRERGALYRLHAGEHLRRH